MKLSPKKKKKNPVNDIWLPGSAVAAGHRANSGEENRQPTTELSTFLSLLVGFAEPSEVGPAACKDAGAAARARNNACTALH